MARRTKRLRTPCHKQDASAHQQHEVDTEAGSWCQMLQRRVLAEKDCAALSP